MNVSNLKIGCLVVATVIIGLIIYLGYFVPVYFDEVAYRLIHARFWLDGGYSVSVFPHCQKEVATKIPLVFIPYAILESWLYSSFSSLSQIRLMGIANFLLWLLVFFLLCKEFSTKSISRALDLFLIGFFAITLGVLPLGLLLNRPEQTLLLSVMLFFWLGIKQKGSTEQDLGLAASFFFLSTFFFSIHPKTLLFLPFVLCSLWFLKVRPKTKGFLLFHVLLMAGNLYLYSGQRVSCPLVKPIAEFNKTQMLTPTDLFENPTVSLNQVARNLAQFKKYVQQTLFVSVYTAEWLPGLQELNLWMINLNRLIRYLLYLILSLVAGWVTYSMIKSKLILTEFVVAGPFFLFLGTFLMAALQTRKHGYEANFIIPVYIVIFVVVIATYVERNCRIIGEKLPWLLFVLSLVSMASVGSLFYQFYPFTKTTWREGGPVKRQGRSYSVFDSAEINQRILTLSARCGIQNTNTTRHLVVDDLTLPLFWKTFQPLYSGVSWHNENILQFLREKHSSGAILECRFLPEDIVKKSFRDGEFCCHPAF